MKIRFLMAWQKHRKGDVLDLSPTHAQTLLRMRWNGRPFAEEVRDEPPVPQAAPVLPAKKLKRQSHDSRANVQAG